MSYILSDKDETTNISEKVADSHFIVDIISRVHTNDSRSKCPNSEGTRLKSRH